MLEELGADERTREVPVILLTARAQDSDKRRRWLAGCAEYLTKPFSPAILAETVWKIAGMNPQEREAHREHQLAQLGP